MVRTEQQESSPPRKKNQQTMVQGPRNLRFLDMQKVIELTQKIVHDHSPNPNTSIPRILRNSGTLSRTDWQDSLQYAMILFKDKIEEVRRAVQTDIQTRQAKDPSDPEIPNLWLEDNQLRQQDMAANLVTVATATAEKARDDIATYVLRRWDLETRLQALNGAEPAGPGEGIEGWAKFFEHKEVYGVTS
jgi:hypothetical protein